MIKRVLALSVSFILFAASPVLAQDAWWIHCPICGQKLDRVAWYGPFPTLEACQAEVRVLRAQGVTAPPLPCQQNGPSKLEEEESNFFSALPSGLRGPLLIGAASALVASFSEREGKEKTRDVKAWTGGGVATGALFEALVSPASNPVLLMMMAGAGTYVGTQAYGEEREAQNQQTAEDTRKQTGLATAGAVAVVGSIALINKATGFRWTPPSSLRRLHISVSGKAVWMRWSW